MPRQSRKPSFVRRFTRSKRVKQFLKGGLADKMSAKDFDPVELRRGQRVEAEHTNDPRVAREIAMDHLKEDPKYYEKLAKIEQKR